MVEASDSRFDPLMDTVAKLDRVSSLTGSIRLVEVVPSGWTLCSDVDSHWLSEWEMRVADGLESTLGTSHPMAAAAYSLIWYASVPGLIGGAFFRASRRVPSLARESLAFRLAEGKPYPDAYALLNHKFWCLPDDPAAVHPSATVVTDESELATVLRRQMRAHSDDFLAEFQPRARLPKRALRGAFQDETECGIWVGGDQQIGAAPEVLHATRLVFPGKATEFGEETSMYVLDGFDGQRHLSRNRIACCYYYKIDPYPCGTCPRTDQAERRRRYATAEEN